MNPRLKRFLIENDILELFNSYVLNDIPQVIDPQNIAEAFVWEYTLEGWKYWNALNNKFRKYE